MTDRLEPQDIKAELEELQLHMKEVAAKMEYYGGLNRHIKQRSDELFRAGCMVSEWADDIEGVKEDG